MGKEILIMTPPGLSGTLVLNYAHASLEDALFKAVKSRAAPQLQSLVVTGRCFLAALNKKTMLGGSVGSE
jgi:hypothetical protein